MRKPVSQVKAALNTTRSRPCTTTLCCSAPLCLLSRCCTFLPRSALCFQLRSLLCCAEAKQSHGKQSRVGLPLCSVSVSVAVTLDADTEQILIIIVRGREHSRRVSRRRHLLCLRIVYQLHSQFINLVLQRLPCSLVVFLATTSTWKTFIQIIKSNIANTRVLMHTGQWAQMDKGGG